MKVENMRSTRSYNKIANQFVISDGDTRIFQSYDSIIAKMERTQDKMLQGYYGVCDVQVTLDEHYWDYSVTTSKYRNQFLGESKKETQAKIDSGEYQLADLNE